MDAGFPLRQAGRRISGKLVFTLPHNVQMISGVEGQRFPSERLIVNCPVCSKELMRGSILVGVLLPCPRCKTRLQIDISESEMRIQVGFSPEEKK